MLKLSDYVIRAIADRGVKHVFLVTGGGAMHLNESLVRFSQIEPICNLHEQASAIAAETYSKATNHLGVAIVTSGPGSTNAITGVAGAWFDSTPLLVLSGQVKRADLIGHQKGAAAGVRQLGVQEINIVPIVQSITKYAVTIDDPRSIRYHVEKALYLAGSGRPGPVWLDIPLDVQASPIEPDELPGFEIPASGVDVATLEREVREVVERLKRAERPLLLAGNGIRMARAEREFLELVDLLDIPLETTWLAIDFIGHQHPRFVGRPGAIAPRGANFAVQSCDFLLAIGARLDRIITGYSPATFAKAAHKVIVDVDSSELAKMGDSVHQTVNADAGAFMREMLRQVRADGPNQNRSAWQKRCADWTTRYLSFFPNIASRKGP